MHRKEDVAERIQHRAFARTHKEDTSVAQKNSRFHNILTVSAIFGGFLTNPGCSLIPLDHLAEGWDDSSAGSYGDTKLDSHRPKRTLSELGNSSSRSESRHESERPSRKRPRSATARDSEEVVARDIALGMNRFEVARLWGDPREVEPSGNPEYGNERWIYWNGLSYLSSEKVVYFENGRVVGWNVSGR